MTAFIVCTLFGVAVLMFLGAAYGLGSILADLLGRGNSDDRK